MKPVNQRERNQKIGRFFIIYSGMMLLFLLLLYCSFAIIPKLSSEQQHITSVEIKNFIQGTEGLEKTVRELNDQPQLDEVTLAPVYSNLNQLEAQYSDTVYRTVLVSYRTMVGQLVNAKQNGDPELNLLDKRHQQLLAANNKLRKDIAGIKPRPVPPVGPTPVPTPKPQGGGGNNPMVASQEWGPYYPKLLKGSGYFEEANPNTKFNIWFTAEGRSLVLHVYYEVSHNRTSGNGLDSRVEAKEVVYTAPEGFEVDPASLPIKDSFVHSYWDKTYEDETVTSQDGLLTCRVKGKAEPKIGDLKGSQLSVRLNRPVPLKLAKM